MKTAVSPGVTRASVFRLFLLSLSVCVKLGDRRQPLSWEQRWMGLQLFLCWVIKTSRRKCRVLWKLLGVCYFPCLKNCLMFFFCCRSCAIAVRRFRRDSLDEDSGDLVVGANPVTAVEAGVKTKACFYFFNCTQKEWNISHFALFHTFPFFTIFNSNLWKPMFFVSALRVSDFIHKFACSDYSVGNWNRHCIGNCYFLW